MSVAVGIMISLLVCFVLIWEIRPHLQTLVSALELNCCYFRVKNFTTETYYSDWIRFSDYKSIAHYGGHST
jgi:hypothetical protein